MYASDVSFPRVLIDGSSLFAAVFDAVCVAYTEGVDRRSVRAKMQARPLASRVM
jgi:hypothetical protein